MRTFYTYPGCLVFHIELFEGNSMLAGRLATVEPATPADTVTPPILSIMFTY